MQINLRIIFQAMLKTETGFTKLYIIIRAAPSFQWQQPTYYLKFVNTDNSVGTESACSARDPDLIPGLGRTAGEGIGYPPQYSWASLVAQLVKNLPAIRKTWVRSLDWEDPLEKGKAIYSSILAWRILWTVQSMGSQRVGQD